GRTRPVPERRADAHRDVTAVRPRGASLRPLGARLRFFLDHSMTCDDAGFRGCTDGWPGVVAGRCSGLRARAATRPGSPLYLRNYMSVIRPRLWRTLWITSVPGWTGADSGGLRGMMHRLCTASGAVPSRSGPIG